MKIPNPIKWGFDPRKGKRHKVLKSEKSRKLWGIFKTQHITDQYFDDNILKLLDVGSKGNNIPDGENLYWIAADLGFRGFGVKPARRVGYFAEAMVPDVEFWNGVYDFIKGKIDVDESFEGVE